MIRRSDIKCVLIGAGFGVLLFLVVVPLIWVVAWDLSPPLNDCENRYYMEGC